MSWHEDNTQPDLMPLGVRLDSMRKRLVIFDLDGTLLNTIADLAAAANYALRELGYPAHSVDTIRSFVGNGVNKLLERALPVLQHYLPAELPLPVAVEL